jgi:hypothetical protein
MKIMNNSNHKTFKRINDDKLEMTICDDLMNCPECVYSIFKIQEQVVNEIIENYYDDIPLEITRIKISINPNEDNVKHYSFHGIEEIIKQLFHLGENINQKELNEYDIYLKVFFSKNNLYNIPVLNVEFFIFKNISDNNLIGFSNFLNAKLINIIGSKGTIERIKITHSILLKNILETTLLMGQHPFSLDGIYKSMGFTDRQLTEMNHLLGATIIKLNNFQLLIEKDPHPFDEMRAMIYEEKKDKDITNKIATSIRNLVQNGEPSIKMEKGEIEDIKYALSCETGMDEERINEVVNVLYNSGLQSKNNDLPF